MMDREQMKFLHNNEGIVIRKYGISEFIVRKISSDKDMNSYNLIKLIKHPLIVSSKESGPLFKIGVPSSKSIHSSTPIEYITRLLMDYDNDSSDKDLLRKFCDKFKDYSFLLYTSWSHSILKPRFRVIIKVKEPINRIYLKDANYREYLSDVFSIGREKPDSSCFLETQLQLLPIVSEKNKSVYKYVINKGKKLELEGYDKISDIVKEKISKSLNEVEVEDINNIVESNSYNNLNMIDSKELEKFKKDANDDLIRIKKKNFNKTAEYKKAKKEIENNIKKDKEYYDNKNEFLKKKLPKAVGNKNLKYFYDEWFKYYKFDIRENKKWYKKFKEFLPKVAKYCGVDERELND